MAEVASTQGASPDALLVGRIDKAHGIRGEVIVTLLTNRLERVDPESVLFTGTEDAPAADGLALTVIASRPHQHRYLVHFAGYRTRNEAEELRGTELWAEPIEDPDELWVHELVGASVVDTAGEALGTVAAVESNPASDLLILSDDSIVPLTFFVERLDDGSLVVDPPEGLFDLDGDEPADDTSDDAG